MLLTNFHLPKSSLMMLVSSFYGYKNTRDLYTYAIDKGFQFVTVGSDSRFISAGAKNTVDKFKGNSNDKVSKTY